MFLDGIISQIGMAYLLWVIHADLSEYNIFVYECGVQFIDWPQYVNPEILNSAILEWEIVAQEKRMAQKEQQLKLLVDEYKSERRRELV